MCCLWCPIFQFVQNLNPLRAFVYFYLVLPLTLIISHLIKISLRLHESIGHGALELIIWRMILLAVLSVGIVLSKMVQECWDQRQLVVVWPSQEPLDSEVVLPHDKELSGGVVIEFGKELIEIDEAWMDVSQLLIFLVAVLWDLNGISHHFGWDHNPFVLYSDLWLSRMNPWAEWDKRVIAINKREPSVELG